MTTIADGLKDVFLAGVGAMALGAEKTQELVEQLIAKGEITVEQGKAINSEVLKQAQATAERVGRDAQTAAGEAAHQAKTAASHLNDQAKTAVELAHEQTEAAVSMARSQAEMAADAAKKAAGEAKKDSADFATALKHDVLEAQMAMMTPEQRAEFAKSRRNRRPRRESRITGRKSCPTVLHLGTKRNPHVAGSFRREGFRALLTKCRRAGSCPAGSQRWCRRHRG